MECNGSAPLPRRSKQSGSVGKSSKRTQPLTVMQTLVGECLCGPFPFTESRGLSTNAQFIELHGIEFISLGAMADELKPKQRVQETVEQLLSSTERLISIGYLVDEEMRSDEPPTNQKSNETRKITETVPLVVWNQNYPNDRNMSRSVSRTINSIKGKEFTDALQELARDFEAQKAHPNRGINKYIMGITAHNMAVIHVLAGQDNEALPLFQQAVSMKRASFGEDHPEVALSLDEIGIQLFARQEFQRALEKFNEARKIRKSLGPHHPKVAMLLNNIGCCHFQMGNQLAALVTFQEARDVQQNARAKKTPKSDLDLLHEAITLGNLGYMKLHLKRYEDAQELFQDALLIQQSVLGEDANSRAIRDTLMNLEFTNAFHS